MKIKSLILLLLISFAACSSNDYYEEIGVDDPDGKITLEQATVNVYLDQEAGATEASIKITEGAGDYSIINLSTDIAEATVEGDVVKIIGHKLGTASFILMDKDSNMKTFSVAVGYSELVLDKDAVSIKLLKGVKKAVNIDITKGSGGYTYSVDVDSLVTVKFIGEQMAITNLKSLGKATITVKDRMGNTTSIIYNLEETLEPYDAEELEGIMRLSERNYVLGGSADPGWGINFINKVENDLNVCGYEPTWGSNKYIIKFPGDRSVGEQKGCSFEYANWSNSYQTDNLAYFKVIKNDGNMFWAVFTYAEKDATVTGYLIDKVNP